MAKRKQKLKKKIRYDSLKPSKNTRVRAELLDYSPEYLEFLKKNHPEEYKYLAQFTDEWVGGAIKKVGTKKTKDGKIKYNTGTVEKGHIHNTIELAKDVMDRNNRRNNDVLGVSKANNLATDVLNELANNDGWYITNTNLTEDALISRIEENDSEDAIMSREEFLELKEKIDNGDFYMTPEMYLFYLAYYNLE